MFERFKKLLEDYQGSNDDGSNLTIAQLKMQDEGHRKAIEEQFEQDVINYIKEQYADRQKQKKTLELQWRLNINYYNGDQFTYIDTVTDDIKETPVYTSWEERNVYNEIAPNLETRFAFLTNRKNKMKNRPASSSAEDRTAAKIGNKVLASTASRLNLSELQQEANLIAGIMGTVIWKTTWDSSKGRVVGLLQTELDREDTKSLEYDEYEKLILGDAINLTQRYIREGDVNTTIHSPFEFYPENITKSLRDNHKVMHVVLMQPEEVYEKWGIIEEGEDNSTYKLVSSSDRMYGGAISGRMAGRTLGVATIKNSVKVYEEHELPSPRYPKGRLIICTDHHLLHYGSLPDPLGENGEYEFCFDVQQSLKTDGFFGKSLVERMIPIQNKYNSLKNRKQDYINRVTMGVLVAPEGSLTDEDYLRDNGIGPGEILTYHIGSEEPHFMEMGSLPSTFGEEEKNLLDEFNRFAGVSSLAQQSTLPSNVSSGTAISTIAEQDDTRIGLEAENIKACLEKVGRKWLVLYRIHVKYARMVKDIGRNEAFEIDSFIGNSITSFDVFIESEPASADSLAQRREKVIELLNSGLFNDPSTGTITNEGRIKVFELLQMGDWENFVSSDDAHQRRADRENNDMVVGIEPTIRSFDDDVVHINRHNIFRASSEYEEAISKDPEIDQMFEAHINNHLHNLQEKNAQQPQQYDPNTGMPIPQQPTDAQTLSQAMGQTSSSPTGFGGMMGGGFAPGAGISAMNSEGMNAHNMALHQQALARKAAGIK